MIKSIAGLMVATSTLALTAGPALAITPTRQVSEPGALAIFAIGIVGAIAVAKFRGRK